MAKRGRPPGSKNKATIKAEFDKEQLRLVVRERIAAEIGPMLDAQIANAKGIKFLMARARKGGKFVRLTQEMVEAIQSGQDTQHELIEVWEKDPSVQAFTDLLNRTIDKPTDHVETTGDSTISLKIAWQSSE